ncbi:Sugar transporter, partial [Operophtera brumata]
LFICAGAWMLYFLCGLSFGTPTVMIPQLRRAANSTEAVSEDMATSIYGFTAMPWVVIICIFTRKYGRKIPFSIVSLNTISYYCLMYFSVNTTQILISVIMQGMNHASNMTLSVIVVTEYASPKYRGAFLAFKSATLFWGIWVANAMGTFFYWKYIPLLGIFLSIFCFTVLFWPESPQWLASKGRFEECVSAHRWLRGTDSKAEKELKQLIQSQTDSIKSREIPNSDNIVKLFSRKEFHKPMLLSVLMMMQYHFSGKVVCMVYSIDIIRKITDSESAAYTGMLILDGVTVTGMYFGCYLSKILKRRQLFFSTCTLGILFLFILSLYLYLVDLKVLTENRILTIFLFTIFSVSISCGPMILSTSIYGELTPLRYKSSCTMISALVFVILTSVFLKLFPLIARTVNMSGVFLIYAISSLIVTSILFKYLPETKDRTLQEIEDIFSNKKMTEEEKGNTQLMTVKS